MIPPPAGGNSVALSGRSVPSMRGEDYEAFVVRLLVGYDGDVVHGQLTHVTSGQQLHFRAPEDLPSLIRRQLAIAHSPRLAPRTKPS